MYPIFFVMTLLLNISTLFYTDNTWAVDARIPVNNTREPVPDLPSLANINAHAYVLMDAASGYIIASNNMDERFPPASLTKMMTSYLVSEQLAEGKLQLSDRAGISRNAAASKFPGGSRMWLQQGSKVTVDDLQRGLVIASGNDAAVALAEHVSNKVEKFVDLMNQKADALGMLNTQFKNPHGLPDEDQYSSAKDMAILARAVVWDYPEDYFLYREKSFSFNGVAQSNRNTLLWENPFVDGIKTGFTKKAGYCLVASAKKNEMRLIAVVLGTKSEKARAWESQKLLSYGFAHYQTYIIHRANDVLTKYRVWGGKQKNVRLGVNKDVYLTLPRGRKEQLQSEIIVSSGLSAPLELEQEVGRLQVSLDEEILLDEPILAMDAVPEAGFIGRVWDAWVYFFVKLFS